MPDFTNGKWNFIEWPVSSDKEEKQKYLIGSPERAIGFIFHEADARLIAAAPEMYRTLVKILDDTQNGQFASESEIIALLDRIAGKDTGHE